MALFSNDPDRNIRPEHVQDPSQSPALQAIQSPTEHGAGPSHQPSFASRDAGAYLNQSSKVTGKLTFEAQARVDGQVEGEINAKDGLMIGESAVVTAQIKASSIIVAGTVKGEITAIQRVEIRPSAKVFGNVTTPKLIVHEGAMFEGHCAMPSEAVREDRKVTVFPKEERKMAQAAAQKQA